MSVLLVAFGACACTLAAQPSGGPQRADLRPRYEQLGLAPRGQGSRGTCSVFAMTSVIELAVSARAGRGVRLSEEYLNWAANKATGDKTDGGFFHDLWKGYETYGVCREPFLPYRVAFDADLQPSKTARLSAASIRALHLTATWIKRWDITTGLTAEHVAAIRATLASGYPVASGMRWPKQATWSDGVLAMCGPEDVFDGHSVIFVGYEDNGVQPGGGCYLVRDSHGDGQYERIPYAYAHAYTNDAVWVH